MIPLWQTEQLAALPEFERERCLVLHEICRAIETWKTCGTPLETCWNEACKLNAGRMLANGRKGHKALPLSFPTLVTHWYKWLKNKSPLAFIRNFKPGLDRMPAALIQEFRRICTMEGCEYDTVAYKSLLTKWRQGASLPGLGTWQEWYAQKHPEHPLPAQAPEFPYTYSALQKRAPKGMQRALGNEGVAAMRREAPHLVMDYSTLRPCEMYVSDDARLDLLVIDDQIGKATTVVIYLMMEVSCRNIVSYVLRPATAICAADVDEMLARGLQASGIGNGYPTHILFERGTVAMSDAKQALLERWFDGHLKVHRTSMDGGQRYKGAASDRATGHWMAKGMIESFIRKLHLALMDLPGQTGSWYRKTPSNLFSGVARKLKPGTSGAVSVTDMTGGKVAEAEALAQLDLQFENRLKLQLPLLTFTQLNDAVRAAITRHNDDPNHNYQDFQKITIAEVQPGVWQPLEEIEHVQGEAPFTTGEAPVLPNQP